MPTDLNGLSKEERKLFDEAIETYQLKTEHVFSFSIYAETKEAVIVTKGGQKIRHRKGDPASIELSETDKTGIAPEEEIVWIDRLNGRVKRRQINERK